MPYQITQRQKKLLKLLSHETVVTSDVLANLLSVTSRTVRSEVNAVNTVFGCKVILSTSKGYSIDPQYFSVTQAATVYSDENSLRMQMIWKIFSGKCSRRADELAEEFFVNVTQIHQLLRSIHEILKPYQLQLIKNNSFFQVEGSEFARRIFLNTMVLADAHNAVISDTNPFFDKVNLPTLRSVILDILFQNNITPEQVNMDSLTLNIAITFDRLIRKNPINYIILQLPYLTDSPEYQSAKMIATYFTRQYHLPVSDYDLRYFYLLIFGQTKHRYENMLNSDFVDTIDNILKQAFQQFNLVCPYEPVLENLAYHIYFLIIRCRVGNATYNSLLDNLKNKCPFIYEVAVYLANLINIHFSVVVADSEIGFLALAMGGMLNHDEMPSEKLHTVIVCGGHQTIGEGIIRQLDSTFSSELTFLGTIPRLPHNINDVGNILFLSCLSETTPYKNVLSIGSIISRQDIQQIKEYINVYRHEMEREIFAEFMKDFFDEELFFHNLRFTNKYEVIRFLSEQAIKKGFTNENFTEQVLQRERTSSTCFMDAFAIPHPLLFTADRSIFCILSSDGGIPWDQHRIKFVCLLVLSQKDRERFHSLYQKLVNMFCEMPTLAAISNASTFSDFMEQIRLAF